MNWGSWTRPPKLTSIWQLNHFLNVIEEVMRRHSKKSCTIIISLTKKTLSGWKKFSVGFAIHQLKGGKKTTTVMSKKILKTKKPIGTSGELRFFPEVTKRFELKPGSYAIIPYTEEANQECDFLLRVFSEKPCFLKGLKAWIITKISNSVNL